MLFPFYCSPIPSASLLCRLKWGGLWEPGSLERSMRQLESVLPQFLAAVSAL